MLDSTSPVIPPTNPIPAHRAPACVRNYALGGLVLLLVVAVWRNTPQLSPGLFNWAESGNTAAALAEGRGFSDPFMGGNGPTAWVPPLFVWIVAGVFLIAGVKTPAAALVLLGMAVLGLAAAHAFTVAAIPPAATWLRRGASAAFLALATLMPFTPLVLLSEGWLPILLSMLLLWGAIEHRRNPGRRATAALVATAVLAPLGHAGVALSAALVLVVLFVLDAGGGRRALVLAAAAGALAVAGWTVRNAVVFGRFVPLKSNLWFELHLANVLSADGLPRSETVLRGMPFFNDAEFARYSQLGEIRYVEAFRDPTSAALRANPGQFAANIVRRLSNALVYCRLTDGSMTTQMRFSVADAQRLAQAGLLLPFAGSTLAAWPRIDMPPAQAHATISALRLDDFPNVWRDWTEKHTAYNERHFSPRGLLLGFVLAGLPTFALLGAALAGRGRLPPIAGWTILIAAGMLAPFVLVNHSVRHQGPLLGLHAIAIGVFVHAATERWRERYQLRCALPQVED